MNRRIGLALSGGGARCFAQIGVLLALEEAGYTVSAIAANSSAAIIAAVYATVADARDLHRIFRETDLVKLLDAGGVSGLLGHDGIRELLAEHAAPSFEELRIPLIVPTVDIQHAELFVFSSGELAAPVCASNAFPGLFVPVEHQGRFLMDGGIINNFPVDLIRTITTDKVLAVDVRSPLDDDLGLGGDDSPDSLLQRLGQLFSREDSTPVDLVIQAYKITQGKLMDVTMALHPPDVLLVPELPADLQVQSFNRLSEAIEIGRASAEAAITSGRFAGLD